MEEKSVGIVRRVARWIPLATFVLLAAMLWTLLWRGGAGGVAAWYGIQVLLPAFGVLALIGTLVYAARTRRWRSPAVLATLVGAVLALVPLTWALGLVPLRYPASLDTTGPAATVRLPMDGPIRVAWGGDRLETNYHAATPDQRWAYDLVVEPAFSGSDRLEDYGCYGVAVVAPASGTVTAAHDGEPDARPGVLSNNIEAPLGNHVAIRLDPTGTHLILAHLQPGSVAVQTGDQVVEGEVVGRCGNSGNTSEPHVHVHHQWENPAGRPVGFAEGLPLYFRDHDGPPMPEGGIEERGGEPVATGAFVRHLGSGTE